MRARSLSRSSRLRRFDPPLKIVGMLLSDEEKLRYSYPNVRVIPQGGPYFKWPWQRLYKVDMTIQTVDITWDPDIEQASIEAVVNPPKTNYLYFVARGDGSSEFSSTLAEHNRAVAKYQKGAR